MSKQSSAAEGSAAEPMMVGEVSRELKVSPDRVRQLHRIGKLQAIRTASGVRIFSRGEVEELRRQRERK